jgi:hypothetical protein
LNRSLQEIKVICGKENTNDEEKSRKLLHAIQPSSIEKAEKFKIITIEVVKRERGGKTGSTHQLEWRPSPSVKLARH